MPKNITHALDWLTLPIGALLCACSRHAVDLGDEVTPQSVAAPETRCGDSGIVPDAVVVKTQADLDALAGCGSIAGGLQIQVFRDIDLSPLGSLRSVAGVLDIQDAAAGWLESLHGLEALEQVGGLNIWNTKASSLEPLSHLQKLDYSPLSGPPGAFSLRGNDNLKDLHGLDAAQGLRSLDVSANSALESLSGLLVSEQLGDINIANSPALTNIDALAPLTYADGYFALASTGLRDLNPLSSLQHAGALTITNNPRLGDVSGLSSLTSVTSLRFQSNALTVAPSLSHLAYVGSLGLSIVDEPELTKLTIDIPSGTSDSFDQDAPSKLDTNGDLAIQAGSTIEVGRCNKLQRVDIPSSLSSAYVLGIHDNASLTDVTLANLQHLDYLVIDANPKLAQLALGNLQTVGSLEIVDNPKLSTAGMSSLRTLDSRLSGNSDGTPSQ
jgi:hypothetical protein